MAEIVKTLPAGTAVELWFQMKCGSARKTASSTSGRRREAARASRPGQPADQRYENAYLFGAVCPARDVGAALAMPAADTEVMQKHLEEIARTVATGAHAIMLLDRAAWHTTGKLKIPENLTLLPIPPACPGLPRAQRRREHLAVPAPDLSHQPHLRRLRRDHRRLLRRLAQARSRGRTNPIHSHTQMG